MESPELNQHVNISELLLTCSRNSRKTENIIEFLAEQCISLQAKNEELEKQLSAFRSDKKPS